MLLSFVSDWQSISCEKPLWARVGLLSREWALHMEKGSNDSLTLHLLTQYQGIGSNVHLIIAVMYIIDLGMKYMNIFWYVMDLKRVTPMVFGFLMGKKLHCHIKRHLYLGWRCNGWCWWYVRNVTVGIWNPRSPLSFGVSRVGWLTELKRNLYTKGYT